MKILAIIAAILFATSLHAETFVKATDSQMMSSIRQLSMVISFYNEEYLANNPRNVPTSFPQTLNDLVDNGYLKEFELSKLLKVPGKIYYFPPSSQKIDPNLPFLFGYYDGTSYLGFPGGNVNRYVTLKTDKSFWPMIIGLWLLTLIVVAIFSKQPVKAEQGAAANP
jgi:hypothetical protein